MDAGVGVGVGGDGFGALVVRAAEERVSGVCGASDVSVVRVEAYVDCLGGGEAAVVVRGEAVFCVTHGVCLVPSLASLVEEVGAYEEGDEA